MRIPLDKSLRNKLEKTIGDARKIAEEASRLAIQRLCVGDITADKRLTPDEKLLRIKLRVHGQQLGDQKIDIFGEQSIDLLAEETAYQYWHRMLFARFLAENNLLMYRETKACSASPSSPIVPVTLTDCEELAKEKGKRNGLELAAESASKMLPQIFRVDLPVFEIKLASNYIQNLESLLNDLPSEVFQAADSLGWVYQFWQSERKEAINKTNKKIGAKELPAVTQLFTEPYMVSFLLDNSLGAWWATRRLTQEELQNAESEEELRQKVALPGMPLEYLRFVKNKAGSWIPAAGIFEDWPKKLKDFKVLDPCCGSGHFLVAAFQMLVPIRMELEKLSIKEAIDAVLRKNIHGLELDMRCVEIAAFNLAFTAWTFPGAEGYRILPELQIACSGVSVGASKEEWIKIGKKDKVFHSYFVELLYAYFKDAPVLGSLIDLLKFKVELVWDDVKKSIINALKLEDTAELHEIAVAAQSIARAAEILDKKYDWIITNPPYLARGKQDDTLKIYLENYYSKSKNDIATAFLEHCLKYCEIGGTISIVLPQNWLFLTTYKHLREKLLKDETWRLITRLGSGAFRTISGEVVKAILLTISRGNNTLDKNKKLQMSKIDRLIRGIDISEICSPAEKDAALINGEIKTVEQTKQLENPDARIAFDDADNKKLLSKKAYSYQGIATGDYPHYGRFFWEVMNIDDNIWIFQQSTVNETCHFGGKSNILYWDNGDGELATSDSARIQGLEAWTKWGIAVAQMRKIPVTLHTSTTFDNNTAIIIPKDETHLPAIWCYCSSSEYNEAVRNIDQKLSVTNATLVKIPFDLNHWKKVAAEKYPHGLPNPYSDDPTQWIFHGHPCGSVVWDEGAKKTAHGKLRCDKTVLQIAVARLLGYQWPAELDDKMELAPEQREWVKRCGELSQFADGDGIVPIPAMRSEASAENRLMALLEAAYGSAWTLDIYNQLLKDANCQGRTLEYWLRNEFFAQHCELFQARPFIWHIWDGLKDGFSVLVNYHKLDSRLLDSLIYTYLGDWTARMEREKGSVDGAAERLDAAKALQQKLIVIQRGEKPCDIFVRWKPLDKQPAGWNPDLNDGVRLNIRPFISCGDVRAAGAGVLRIKPKIKWENDRGKDVESAPWYILGPKYGVDPGTRINDHHLTLAEKQKAQEAKNA